MKICLYDLKLNEDIQKSLIALESLFLGGAG